MPTALAISPLHLPYISPTSLVDLPYTISPVYLQVIDLPRMPAALAEAAAFIRDAHGAGGTVGVHSNPTPTPNPEPLTPNP